MSNFGNFQDPQPQDFKAVAKVVLGMVVKKFGNFIRPTEHACVDNTSKPLSKGVGGTP